MSGRPGSRDHLPTERDNPRSADLDRLSIEDPVETMRRLDGDKFEIELPLTD